MEFSLRLFCSIIVLYGISFSFSSSAQSFQWGKRAGSAQSVSESDWERVNSMAVDVHGNVYALGHVAEDAINVDGNVRNGNGDWDIVLASFTCSGSLRWWKVIGGPGRDYTYTVGLDKLDGVYVSCFLDRSQGGNTIHIDSDTTFSGNSLKGVSLIKYDTSGHYKWYRAPQADTISVDTHAGTYELGMTVDSAGNVYWMWQMAPSAYFNGTFIVPATNDYIIQYDRYGGFVGITDLKSEISGGHLARDPNNGRFYYAGYTGYGTIAKSVNGVTLVSPKYIVAYDSKGKVIWVKQGQANVDGFYGSLAIDKQSNIYVAGQTQKGEIFDGYATKFTGNHSVPVILKLDVNGNLKWGNDAYVNGATFGRGGVAIRNSGEVILHGNFPGLLKWPGYTDSFNLPFNSGYRPFITRFNTQTGKVLGMDQLPATGNATDEFATVADGRNNIYIGGYFDGSLTVAGNTLSKIGGESDWFLAKYGQSNCNCSNIPEPMFSMTANGKNTSFNYTGSTGITTYRWDFGDGDTSIVANPSHTFKDSGNFIVCLKVTNGCGDNTYCSQVHIYPTDVGIISVNNISIYPNPAHDAVYIDGMTSKTDIAITDITGRSLLRMQSSASKETIDLGKLAPGSYFIQLTDNEGNRTIRHIIKE